jgi:hypothetical protein
MNDPLMRLFPTGDEEPEAAQPTEEERLQHRRWRIRLLALTVACCAAFGMMTVWFSRSSVPLAIAEADSEATHLVREHFAALERGDFRTAYEQFSSRYRERIPFTVFHDMVVEHWQLLEGKVVVVPQLTTPSRVVLEVSFDEENGSTVDAEFTLVRSGARWWIDDERWGRERVEHLIRT